MDPNNIDYEKLLKKLLKKPWFLAVCAVILIALAVGMIVMTVKQNKDDSSSSESTTVVTSEDVAGGQESQETQETTEIATAPELDTSDEADDTQEDTTEEPVTETEYVEYYFRSKSQLDGHYEKHGIEMGFADKYEYQKAASDVINNPKALTKTEKEDGDYVYYVEETNEFVILSTDGYIRTYFNPSAGKKYFDRQ